MQTTLPRSELFRAVSAAQPIVERRHTTPILANLLLEADEGALTLTANDMETALRVRTPAEVSVSGAVTVNARKLFEILRELPDDEAVTLERLDGFVSLRSGRSRFRLASMPAEEFPSIVEEEAGDPILIPGADLASAIAAAAYAVSTDETRRYLTGVLFETSDDGELRLVATDGHRLALRRLPGVGASRALRCIVPRKAVQEIRRLSEQAEEVRLWLGERQVRLEADDALLAARLIDAKFPDYEDVLPRDHPNVAVADRAALDTVLRRAMVIAAEFPHALEVGFGPEGIEVAARNFEQEEAQERAEAEYQGEPRRLGFNGRYLRDALGAIEAERVRIALGDEMSPALFHGEGSDLERHVVMPMRL